jgi:hypothetical protein
VFPTAVGFLAYSGIGQYISESRSLVPTGALAGGW